MNESIFLRSFFSNHRSGSKFLTSAAILVENCVVSNREISETPLRPSQRPFHVSSVPVPSAVTNPTPVTTTLLFCKLKPLHTRLSPPLHLGFRKVTFDIVDGVLHCRDLFSVFIGNLHSESLFERHDQLDGIQGIRAEVVDKRSGRRHFGLVDTQLLDDNLFHLIFN